MRVALHLLAIASSISFDHETDADAAAAPFSPVQQHLVYAGYCMGCVAISPAPRTASSDPAFVAREVAKPGISEKPKRASRKDQQPQLLGAPPPKLLPKAAAAWALGADQSGRYQLNFAPLSVSVVRQEWQCDEYEGEHESTTHTMILLLGAAAAAFALITEQLPLKKKKQMLVVKREKRVSFDLSELKIELAPTEDEDEVEEDEDNAYVGDISIGANMVAELGKEEPLLLINRVPTPFKATGDDVTADETAICEKISDHDRAYEVVKALSFANVTTPPRPHGRRVIFPERNMSRVLIAGLMSLPSVNSSQ